MILLENIKRIAEKATGWRRPEDPHALLRERKPQTHRFKDDGVIPNHPKWPLIITRARSGCRNLSTPQLCSRSCLTATAGESRDATATTMPTIIPASTRSLASRAVAVGSNSEERKDALSLGMWQSFRRARTINVSRQAKIFGGWGLPDRGRLGRMRRRWRIARRRSPQFRESHARAFHA